MCFWTILHTYIQSYTGCCADYQRVSIKYYQYRNTVTVSYRIIAIRTRNRLDHQEAGLVGRMDTSRSWTHQQDGHIKKLDSSAGWTHQETGLISSMDPSRSWTHQQDGHIKSWIHQQNGHIKKLDSQQTRHSI